MPEKTNVLYLLLQSCARTVGASAAFTREVAAFPLTAAAIRANFTAT